MRRSARQKSEQSGFTKEELELYLQKPWCPPRGGQPCASTAYSPVLSAVSKVKTLVTFGLAWAANFSAGRGTFAFLSSSPTCMR